MQRTRAALKNGVDLVVELPILWLFSLLTVLHAGALQLLNDLQVPDVVFGAEHPSWDFSKLVMAEQHFNEESFEQFNATYATQFHQQLNELTGQQLTDQMIFWHLLITKRHLKIVTRLPFTQLIV